VPCGNTAIVALVDFDDEARGLRGRIDAAARQRALDKNKNVIVYDIEFVR